MLVSKVLSLFGTEVGHHVKEMEHHIVSYEETVERITTERREDRVEEGEVEDSSTRKKDHPREYYEQKKKVTKPVSLEELFKPRSLKAGDPESEVRKVLLYGNPGSGKTCISKAIAHKWALGDIVKEFEAIYVIPIRRVNTAKFKAPQGATLKGMVAQVCFGERSDAEYEDLLTQVEGDFDSPTTLLMFDGLDEAGEDARELVHSAEERLCKLLILTRPYNLQQIRQRVDCQFECLGFNDQQLTNYIHRELSQNNASSLIRSLQQNEGMWETAHIPVTAHILCSLSRERGIAVEDRRKRASMFQIYGDLTNFVWERFKERLEARTVNKDTVFGDLERIAFEALRSGQILIEERTVKAHVTSTNTTGIFKESGFLLFVLEGQQYQFPHLTFQEYFAGRFIARSLKNKGSDEERRVLKFIQEEKYNQKSALTLTFAMHSLAQKRGASALEELLEAFDEKPVEVLGIRHFFLRMRVLEATLEEADDKDIKEILDDEQAIKLVEGARQLIEQTIDDVLIRKIVIDEFRQLSCVLEEFPKVLNNTIDETEKLLACKHDLTWKETANLTEVSKLARHSMKHSYTLVHIVLQRSEEHNVWCSKEERIRRLSYIIEQMPRHAGEVLPTLAKGCVDEYFMVRQNAMEAIGRVVAAAPRHAGEVLPTLAKGCVDEESNVRQNAMEVIGRVVAAAPRHAGEVLPTLAKGCVDEHSDVRRNAMEAIVRVVAAAPRHAGEVLPTLAKGCVDEDSDVRQNAMEAIGRVVAAAPRHAGEVLPTLAKGCVDEYFTVRPNAMEAIGRVVAAAPRHAGEVLPTLAKGCVDEYFMVRENAMEAIGRVVAAAPRHAGEVLPTLAKGCVDEYFMVRQNAMEAIVRVVAAAPRHAGEVLPTLAKGCVDEDSDVRQNAMEAIGRVVAAAPRHAGEVLPTLAKGCVDEDSDVRQNAMEAIGRVVAAAPRHAGEVLPTLAKGCVDEDSDVRQNAMEAIGRVVAAAPRHAGEVLPTLAKGCVDEYFMVRRNAMEAIGRVVAAAPRHAGEVLPTLAKGCVDEESNVRQNAMEAIGRVVAAAPRHAGEVLPTLAKGCVDEYFNVHQNAMEAIGRVVAAEPRHAGEVLPTLAMGCVDRLSVVRSYAMEALNSINADKVVISVMSTLPEYRSGHFFFFLQRAFSLDFRTKQKAVSIVSHASFSQRIGCWSKNDIDVLVGSLAREFDEKYPELRSHLNF